MTKKEPVVTTNVSEARNSPLKVSYAAHECRKGNAYNSINIIKVKAEWATNQLIIQTRLF